MSRPRSIPGGASWPALPARQWAPDVGGSWHPVRLEWVRAGRRRGLLRTRVLCRCGVRVSDLDGCALPAADGPTCSGS